MASIADPVTMERAYFNTLVRRAKFKDGDLEALCAVLADHNWTVVSKPDYDSLVLVARKYETLRSNLLTGGVTEQTIDLLSQDKSTSLNQQMTRQSTKPPAHNGEDDSNGAPDTTYSMKTPWNPDAYFSPAQRPDRHRLGDGFGGKFRNTSDWADLVDEGPLSEYFLHDNQNANFNQFAAPQSFNPPHYPRICKRTIVLAGIPDNTTHEHVTKVVRGGILLEVYIKAAEHSAHVSFLHEEDAARFYDHSRKHNLYINHKRVFIKWADRHFHLAGHVARKIAQGATRNMVIRRCDSNHTEDSLRNDLEHIQNLVVINIEFIGGSCYIKTNSVHNAMFARTCMMSRAKYKGSKIDWDLDECERSFETAPITEPHRPQHVPVTQKPALKVRNRFATLRLDDDDNEGDDRSETSSEFEVPSTIEISV